MADRLIEEAREMGKQMQSIGMPLEALKQYLFGRGKGKKATKVIKVGDDIEEDTQEHRSSKSSSPGSREKLRESPSIFDTN